MALSVECLLRTPRLIVRLPRDGDAAAIAAYYRADFEHLKPYSPAIESILEESYWQTGISFINAEFDAGQSCRTFLYELDDRTVIGVASLTHIIRGPFHACYLGYSIAATHEGRGLMSEALQAVIDYAFDELGLHRIMANYMPRNHRSAVLLKRLGFKIEGHAKDYLFINGQWEEHVLTALTNDAWTEPAGHT